ncbi:kinesin-like protein 5 [Sarcoptes scabiei]|uniref:Kinesin-like protein 5 n=1 Tax=Sarcoptes scabiei TaxID=52283 RepID=A0A131ZZK4_SARSC|nr:kinesin-like protein 5 [Sarcoptes scabiei]
MACTFDESDYSSSLSKNEDYSISNINFDETADVSTTLDPKNELEGINDSGRIETFLRIRPNTTVCEKYCIEENLLRIQQSNGKKSDSFSFTRIFYGQHTQFEVFEKCSLPLLKAFIAGRNSILFTFGVTSSGKTFTMKGTTQQPGIIPLSLIMLFNSFSAIDLTKPPQYKPIAFCDRIKLSEEEQSYENNIRQFIIEKALGHQKDQNEIENFEINEREILEDHQSVIANLSKLFQNQNAEEQSLSVWVSYFEIYNDNIIDLLNVKCENENEPRLFLCQDSAKNYYINRLRQVFVTSATEAFLVYLYGQHNLKQHISQTALNKNSSRSHSIFRLTLIRIDHKNQQTYTSNINFCDLAGAERIAKTGNTGQRAKETSKINQSLSALNHCLGSLKSKKKESMIVSFRTSKLTHVLQPYLFSNGGSFCIIFNLNPSSVLFDESIYSLSLCDSIKTVRQAPNLSYVRRMTLKTDFKNHFNQNNLEKVPEENRMDLEETSEMFDFDYDSIVEHYETLLQQKEKEYELLETQYRRYITEVKNGNEETKQKHEKELEEKEAIYNAKMDINNKNFKSLLEKKCEKIEELENKLFENESELIDSKENLKQKLHRIDELQEEIEQLREQNQSKDNKIEELESKLKQQMRQQQTEPIGCSECCQKRLFASASELLSSLHKKRNHSKQDSQDEDEISAYNKKKAVLIEKQQSSKKLRLAKARPSQNFSPESYVSFVWLKF